MGQLFSYFRSTQPKKLCDDLIDEVDFSLQITIHSQGAIPDYTKLLEHLQSTNPIVSYTYCKSVYLLYSPDIKFPFLRSNVAGEIISGIAAETTRCCLINKICDPYFVEVDIICVSHEQAKNDLRQLIKNNLYYGKMHGVSNLLEF